MESKAPRFNAAFIERSRGRLLALRKALADSFDAGEAEQSSIRTSGHSEAGEYEDGAQTMTQLEIDGELSVRTAARLRRVDRALQKLEEGTYGYSDISGEAIARERLEAAPEAIETYAEQAMRETNAM